MMVQHTKNEGDLMASFFFIVLTKNRRTFSGQTIPPVPSGMNNKIPVVPAVPFYVPITLFKCHITVFTMGDIGAHTWDAHQERLK